MIERRSDSKRGCVSSCTFTSRATLHLTDLCSAGVDASLRAMSEFSGESVMQAVWEEV